MTGSGTQPGPGASSGMSSARTAASGWTGSAPIAASGVTVEATYRLREAILAGRLAAGERIIERDVSEALGLSRGPIREALRQLETEGLVELLPRRGARVATVSYEEAEEVIALRSAVEPVAVTFSLARNGAALLADLQAVLNRLQLAVQQEDWPAAMLLDLEFHGAVYRHSDAQRVQRVWRGLQPFLLRAFRLHPQVYASSADHYTSHLQLLEAFRAGTPGQARTAARDHVLHLTAEVLNRLKD